MGHFACWIHLGGMLTAMEVIVRRGYSDDKDAVRKRLRRIEGQMRGLQRMVDEDRYCIDHCVADAVKSGGDEATEKLGEASAAIARLVRS